MNNIASSELTLCNKRSQVSDFPSFSSVQNILDSIKIFTSFTFQEAMNISSQKTNVDLQYQNTSEKFSSKISANKT
jgi:hypothetical protein